MANRLLVGRFGWLLLSSVFFLGAMSFLGPGDVEDRKRFIDFGQLVTPLVATGCCWLASRRVEGRVARWSWGILALAYAASLRR